MTTRVVPKNVLVSEALILLSINLILSPIEELKPNNLRFTVSNPKSPIISQNLDCHGSDCASVSGTNTGSVYYAVNEIHILDGRHCGSLISSGARKRPLTQISCFVSCMRDKPTVYISATRDEMHSLTLSMRILQIIWQGHKFPSPTMTSTLLTTGRRWRK